MLGYLELLVLMQFVFGRGEEMFQNGKEVISENGGGFYILSVW